MRALSGKKEPEKVADAIIHHADVRRMLAVMKAGGVVIGTMPLLRAKELSYVVTKARVTIALCDHKLADEMEKTRAVTTDLRHVVYWGGAGADALAEEGMEIAAVLPPPPRPSAPRSGPLAVRRCWEEGIQEIIAAVNRPPMNPCQVLPGDTFGASLCLPKSLPNI